MFILKQNVLVVTRYVKNTYKSINNINVSEYHYNILPERMRNFSSQEVKVETAANSDQEPDGLSSRLPKNLEALTKGDKDLEHKLKVIMLETEVLRQDGKPVPENDSMTPDIWDYLLQLPSRSSRTRYLDFLYKRSKRKENELAKKLQKRKDFEEIRPNLKVLKNLPIEEHALNYGLLVNNIFLRIHDITINHLYNRRLIQAMQFGQKLVIDCGYDQNMTRRENYNAAKQIMLLFSDNRYSDEPFDIHYTNINKESDLTKMLHKYIPTMYDTEFPMNIHETSYLDLFPKQKLIYLTPHCQDVMETFDHDAVYILGAIVDKINNEPLSLAKAKREGIVMQKFPLDKYLQWGSGSGKSLTINQCMLILLDMKANGDWKHALRHVPRRKLADTTTSFSRCIASTSSPTQKKYIWRPSTGKKSRF